MANYLKVTQNVTVTSGNYTQSFVVDELVSPYSMWAYPLSNAGVVTDSGQAAPIEDLTPAYPYFAVSDKYVRIIQLSASGVLTYDYMKTEIHATGSTAKTFTIPNDTNSRMNIGANMVIRRVGSGTVSINGQAGVVIRAPYGSTISDQYNSIYLIKINNDEWVVIPQGGTGGGGGGGTDDQTATEVPFSPTGGISSVNVQAAIAELDTEKQSISAKNQINGYAGLDASGKIAANQIPAIAISNVFVTATLTTRNALTVETGDVAVVQDTGGGESGTYIYDGSVWHNLASGSSTNIATDVLVTPTGGIGSTNVQAALAELDTEKIATTALAANNGVATLNSSGKVPASQLALDGGTASTVDKLIQSRRGTAAAWTSANPVLASGEIGYESDSNRVKIGNGTLAWISLPYVTDTLTPAGIEAIQDMLANTFITAGSGISVVYNDTTNTLTITNTGIVSNPLLQNGVQVKLVYRQANSRWEYPNGNIPTFTGRLASITWEGTTAQIPAQGSGDTSFKVGDTALIRSVSL